MVLATDDPTFANWDQDATAVQERYADPDPVTVAGELDVALARLLGQIASVQPGDRDRPALRSNGSRFTMTTLDLLAGPRPGAPRPRRRGLSSVRRSEHVARVADVEVTRSGR